MRGTYAHEHIAKTQEADQPPLGTRNSKELGEEAGITKPTNTTRQHKGYRTCSHSFLQNPTPT